MTLKPEEIQQILESLEGSSWDTAVVTVDDVTISVARNGTALPGTALPGTALPGSTGAAAPAAPPAPAPAAAAAAPAPAAPAPVIPPVAVAPVIPAAAVSVGAVGAGAVGEVLVTAPSVGVFWRAPQPGAPAFVEVGGAVVKGDTVCIVEVMKLMSNVPSPVSGVITAVHVENAAAVEFGTVLFSVRPDGT